MVRGPDGHVLLTARLALLSRLGAGSDPGVQVELEFELEESRRPESRVVDPVDQEHGGELEAGLSHGVWLGGHGEMLGAT